MYNYKWIKMIKVKDLYFWESLYRSVCKYEKDYWEWYYNIKIPVNKSVIKKKLPLFIEKEDAENI